MYDALVIRYDAAKGGTRQPMHRDAALLSVNIALSSPDEYEGGGTLFQTVGGGPVRLGRGHAMVHASGVRHAGAPITAGERWVLVVFALAEGVPQHARRCAERGAEARRAGRLAEARAAFDAAVVACPTDHEARHGLAIVQLMQGEDAEARRSLATAASLYPACPKPRNGLGVTPSQRRGAFLGERGVPTGVAVRGIGSMLLEAGRTRAALRHFEAALERSAEPDDDDGCERRGVVELPGRGLRASLPLAAGGTRRSTRRSAR